MAAEKRVYVVVQGEVIKLVEAQNPAQAIRHVARATITAHVGKQKELIELSSKGVKVEVAGDEA